MELMSSLLLCVSVALLPQTLGKPEFNSNLEIKRAHRVNKNSSRALLLNLNGTPLVNENTELHSAFDDVRCQKCYECMERAIKAHNSYYHSTINRPSAEELQEDLLRNHVSDNRYKRDVQKTKSQKRDTAKVKSLKPKKNKTKSVSVTKYDTNGEVYALKIKENKEEQHKSGNGTCQLYIVKRTLTCNSPESEVVLTEARRHSKMTGKSNETVSFKPSTSTTRTRVAVFKKREVDSETPDFMPSIEEMAY